MTTMARLLTSRTSVVLPSIAADRRRRRLSSRCCPSWTPSPASCHGHLSPPGQSLVPLGSRELPVSNSISVDQSNMITTQTDKRGRRSRGIMRAQLASMSGRELFVNVVLGSKVMATPGAKQMKRQIVSQSCLRQSRPPFRLSGRRETNPSHRPLHRLVSLAPKLVSPRPKTHPAQIPGQDMS